jgi:hypothetical protein
MKYVRLQCTTTGTVLSVQGITATLGNEVFLTNYGNDLGITVNGGTLPTVTNLTQLGGAAPNVSVANGSTNKSLSETQGTAVSQTDVNAGAFAGAGRVNGTVIASAQGGGAVISAEINVSTLTLGTATSVVAVLQESTGGTNFTDVWISDPITTTGIVRMPAQYITGRRRWAFHSIGGTSTTVTVTVTTLELPTGYPFTRQGRDVYSATNPFATVINNTTQTASTFGAATSLGATTQATTPFVIDGCKYITAYMVLAGGPTVTTQPVVSVELSNDLSNWYTTTSTMTAAGNGTYSVTTPVLIFRYARLRVTTAAAYSSGSYTIPSVGINGIN